MDITTTPLALPATADEIRRVAKETLGNAPYVNTSPELARDLIQRVFDWIKNALEPLERWLELLYQTSRPLYYVLVGVCLLALIGLVLHIVWTLYRAMQNDKPMMRAPEGPTDMLKYAADLEAQGNEARGTGDYVAALRFYYRSAIIRIELARGTMPRRGATNRQYLNWFCNTPVYEPLGVLVNSIDVAWFGGVPFSEQQMDQAYLAYTQLTRMAEDEKLFRKN